MSLNLKTYLRKIPPDLLRKHLEHRGIQVAPDFDRDLKPGELAASLSDLIEKDAGRDANLFVGDADRIDRMSDERGEIILFNIVDGSPFLHLTSRHARVASAFLDDPVSFRRAELARATDQQRRTRMWDGYKLRPDLEPALSADRLDDLKQALREHFRSQNVDVDVFKRHRLRAGGEELSLVHLTVFSEGRPIEPLRFENGALVPRPDWPVLEAAMTYEPKTGALEVVTPGSDGRREFARLCAQRILGHSPDQPLPVRRYDLKPLQKPFDFPTDPEDGIERVDVTLLRLMPIDTQSERVVLQCLRGFERSIWAMANDRFGERSPLGDGWIITQAKLTVHLHPREGTARPTITFTITAPHGCDLKEGTEDEILIGHKYLPRWGMLDVG